MLADVHLFIDLVEARLQLRLSDHTHLPLSICLSAVRDVVYRAAAQALDDLPALLGGAMAGGAAGAGGTQRVRPLAAAAALEHLQAAHVQEFCQEKVRRGGSSGSSGGGSSGGSSGSRAIQHPADGR